LVITYDVLLLPVRYPRPRPDTTKVILERALKLYPSVFAPPDVLAERKPTLEDIQPRIIEEGCGLRPARKGGIRLGVEWIDCPGGSAEKAKKTPIVFNYG
jgi:D-amino-acid oxidase